MSKYSPEEEAAYRRGFLLGLDVMAEDIAERLKNRAGLVPPSLKTENPSLKTEGTDHATENPRTT